MKVFLIIWIGVLSAVNISAGDTVYYYGSNFKPVSTFEDAVFQRRISWSSPGKARIKSFKKSNGIWKHEKDVTIKKLDTGLHKIISGKKGILPEISYRKFIMETNGLYAFEEYTAKRIIRTGKASSLIPLVLQDTLKQYYPDGKLQSVSYYIDNQIVSNRNWKTNGDEYIDNLFYSVDKEPEYQYGDAGFKNFLINGIVGSGFDLAQVNDQVVLGWVIMENGELEGIHVISGRIGSLNSLLVKLVRELPGQWEPAVLNGRKVRYYMTLPFNFSNRATSFETLEFNSGFLIWD